MKVLVETERLILRSLDGDHSAEVLDFLYKGRELFEKYEMTKAPLYYSEMYQKSVLSQEHAATLNNKYVRYYVYLKNYPYITVIILIRLGILYKVKMFIE